MESGTITCGVREYDPVSGHWLTPDPIGFHSDDINLYRYVRNRALRFTDPFGLDSAAPELSPEEIEALARYFEEFGKGTKDFTDNYEKMRKANTIGADKYFHCMANCQASRQGQGGKDASTTIGEGREFVDQYLKGDSASACDQDRAANARGRAAPASMSCEAACASLKVKGL